MNFPGKSSWFNNAILNFNKIHKGAFICVIAFNEHTEYFSTNKLENEEEVLNFLQKEVLSLKSDLETKLFRDACKKTGRILFILDGLDEVCPDYSEIAFRIIETINGFPSKGLYISTRPEHGKALEKLLKTFMHNLVPFSQEDQIIYLKSFWKKYMKQPNRIDDDKLNSFAEKIIQSIDKTLGEKEMSITGIPLLIRIVAEILCIKFETSNTSELMIDDMFKNLGELYQAFVEGKIRRYLVEKLNYDESKSRNKAKIQEEIREITKLYTKLAMNQILPKYCGIFEDEFTTHELDDMSKCGLIASNIASDLDDKFIHRTFAEYFVFDNVLENFDKKKISRSLFLEVFVKDSFKTIRSFLDNSLKTKCQVKNLSYYGKVLMQNEDKSYDAFLNVCLENNFHILKLLFESVFAYASNASSVIKFLQKIFDTKTFICNFVKNLNETLDILKLIHDKMGVQNELELLYKKSKLIKLTYADPENLKLLLSWMRNTFENDNEFWKKTLLSSEDIIDLILQKKYEENILQDILNEFDLIEQQTNSNIFASQTVITFGLGSTVYYNYNTTQIVTFLTWTLEKKSFETFLKVMFNSNSRRKDFSKECISQELEVLSHFFLTTNNSSELTFKLLKKVAFKQLIDQPDTLNEDEIDKKLKKLRIKFFHENLILNPSELAILYSLPQYFKISGTRIEILKKSVLYYSAFFYLVENWNDRDVVEIFLNDISKCNNFNDMLILLSIYKMLVTPNKNVGRIILDYNKEIGENSDQMKLSRIQIFLTKLNRKLECDNEDYYENFLSKLKDEDEYKDSKHKRKKSSNYFQIEREYEEYSPYSDIKTVLREDEMDNNTILNNFFSFLLLSVMESVTNEVDEIFFGQILSVKDENSFIWDFPEFFKSFLFNLVSIKNNEDGVKINNKFISVIGRYQKYNDFSMLEHEMFEKLIRWNVTNFESNSEILTKNLLSQNKVGNTILHGVKEVEKLKHIISFIPNEVLEKMLLVKNNRRKTCLSNFEDKTIKMMDAILEKLGHHVELFKKLIRFASSTTDTESSSDTEPRDSSSVEDISEAKKSSTSSIPESVYEEYNSSNEEDNYPQIPKPVLKKYPYRTPTKSYAEYEDL